MKIKVLSVSRAGVARRAETPESSAEARVASLEQQITLPGHTIRRTIQVPNRNQSVPGGRDGRASEDHRVYVYVCTRGEDLFTRYIKRLKWRRQVSSYQIAGGHQKGIFDDPSLALSSLASLKLTRSRTRKFTYSNTFRYFDFQTMLSVRFF